MGKNLREQYEKAQQIGKLAFADLWGGFSDEPVARIRAKVVHLPFIKRERAKELAG